MLKMTMPVRRDRATYRSELAHMLSGPGPYLSLYLDVGVGPGRDEARKRLRANLDRLVRNDGGHLTVEQWSAAGDALDLVEEDDATLVSFIDPKGQALTTGYERRPNPELRRPGRAAAGRPAPGRRAGAHPPHRRTHRRRPTHDADVPRHGPASEIELDVDHAASIPAIVKRSALLSRTAMVVLCARMNELADITAAVRAVLPVEVRLASVTTDGSTAETLEDEIAERLAAETDRKASELVSLWGFHQVHGEAVDGLADVVEAVADGRAPDCC